MNQEEIIQKKLKQIRLHIEEACLRCGRSPQEVRLIGVGKFQPIESILYALDAGLSDIGENYAQELRNKQERFRQETPDDSRPVYWHFIGRLQRRKVRQLVGHVDWIHSLDRIEVAHEIERWAEARNQIQKVLIQVNLAAEAQKGGLPAAELASYLNTCSQLTHLDVVGLMALPPHETDVERSRAYFSQLRQLRDAMNQQAVYKKPLSELSMGMSHDYAVAIEEGATMVRIGTALFGERHGPEK